MAFVDDLKKIKAAEDRRRLDARSTAASIVLGLLVARMEELHPGSREKMLGQVQQITEHLAANEEFDPTMVEDVARYAETLLNTSNT